MDDEKSILELTTRMLTCQGFEVETALNGTTAVAQYKAAREAGNPFDAVLMDLTVPAGMGGFEAFEAMREIDPGVRAILSSGYSHEPVILNYKAHGIAAVAPKPYHMSELITVVQSALAH